MYRRAPPSMPSMPLRLRPAARTRDRRASASTIIRTTTALTCATRMATRSVWYATTLPQRPLPHRTFAVRLTFLHVRGPQEGRAHDAFCVGFRSFACAVRGAGGRRARPHIPQIDRVSSCIAERQARDLCGRRSDRRRRRLSLHRAREGRLEGLARARRRSLRHLTRLPAGRPDQNHGQVQQGDDVFRRRRSLFFKKMQIVRGCDTKRNVLVYMVYSDRLIEGSPKNSTSTVPIMPWGAATDVPKCAEWLER